ncbi:hypothetical protein [Halomonas sp. LBP4]|uniref:hypothetical protein n=1 Tax=Halomonas sp. LBP4 TaxID=2044917 RepID=UPI000D77121B|nr:hypothetical protein [Halomonas sp. LBP4]PXX97595.1 hypothetical protein CR157_12860 [Halomonas sp. LBP4]
MIDFTALTLLPQEQLALASAHETQERRRYRGLARRLLATAPDAGHLMAELGRENEQRLETLQDVAGALGLEACIVADDAEEAPPGKRQRLFVVDGPLERQALVQALEDAEDSRLFFDWLLETNATPELHRPLRDFAAQKRAECRILGERLAQSTPA